jgi:hypothetical protein
MPSAEPAIPAVQSAPGSFTVPSSSAVPILGSALGRLRCAVQGCIKVRINKNCQHRACASHCRSLGGCEVNGHAADPPAITHASHPIPHSVTTTIPAVPAISLSVPAVVPTVTATQVTTNSLQNIQGPPATATQNTQGPPATLDAQPNPRFASQMRPVFTQEMAREEGFREAKRSRDEARLEGLERVKHNVTVYGWSKDGQAPNVSEFQDGYVWPNFKISSAVIEDLELLTDGRTHVFLYRAPLGAWTKIKPDHIVGVENQAYVFLRAAGVSNCHDFDRHLAASIKASAPHFRLNLQAERGHIKAKLEEHEISLAPSPQHYANKGKKRGLASPWTDQPQNRARQQLALPPHHTASLSPRFPSLSPSFPSPQPYDTTPSPPHFVHSHQVRVEPGEPKVKVEPQDNDIIVITDSDTDSNHLTTVQRRRVKPEPVDLSDSPISITSDDSSSASCTSHPKQWPADYYAIDIHNFFEKCLTRAQGISVKQAFEAHFRIPWHRSTYYENKERWDDAPQAAKDQALRAGKSRDGLWSVFTAQNRMRHAQLKASRKRVGHHKVKQESCSDEASSTGSL